MDERRAEHLRLRERYRSITEDSITRMGSGGLAYNVSLGVSALLALGGMVAWGVQMHYGMGVTGLQHPLMWATYITTFVWWIGIAHSGTMISAVLYLFRASFRTSFARTAEAMTLIAILTSAAFPIIHLGRPWRAYWLLPYPNERDLWVTFRSPLILDVFAVVTYLTVSVLFFWLGLMPDAAILRDRCKGWAKTLYGLLAAGWEGKGRQWKHYLVTYSIVAGLATPLVISVHSVVSWDFALAIVPGWHSTIFPPYFVAGAVFSGLAMVLTLVIPMRALLRLEEYISDEHVDQLAQLVLLTSLIVSFSYLLEYSNIGHSSHTIERVNLAYKTTGPYGPLFWIMTVCNSVLPLSLFWPAMRRNMGALFVLSLAINVGMWLERFVIVAGSLARDYLPHAWAREIYQLQPVEWAMLFGGVGWFFFCFLLFVRYLPVLPIAEYRRECLKLSREERALKAAGLEGSA